MTHLAASLLLLTAPAQADTAKTELERCFLHESDTLLGHVILQANGANVLGFEFGNVTTAEGETWGYHSNFNGTSDQGRMMLMIDTFVEGGTQIAPAVWEYEYGALTVREMLYSTVPCAMTWSAFNERGLADKTAIQPDATTPGTIYSMTLDPALIGAKPHELAFTQPNDGVARAEFASDPFYAIILMSAPRCTIPEAERQNIQTIFPRNKVFMERFYCDDDITEQTSYSNVSPDVSFIAIHAGATEAEARALMANMDVATLFPGANIRKMQAIVNYP
ncbi:MAG: hypothetical protein AAFN63_17735 [Pseudomonadota bacterium]